MLLIDFPNGLAGSVTIACLVGLGIFGYPWLLKRNGGAILIGAITALLALLFYAFDRGSNAPMATSILLALLWAVAPTIVGVLVFRLQRGSAGDAG